MSIIDFNGLEVRRMEPETRAAYDIPEVAKLLGISKNMAYLLAGQEGGIPVLRLGAKRMVVPKAAFDEWLATAGRQPVA